MTLAFHPYANLFPLIEGQEFYELAEDIRLTGLRDRIDLIWVGKDLRSSMAATAIGRWSGWSRRARCSAPAGATWKASG